MSVESESRKRGRIEEEVEQLGSGVNSIHLSKRARAASVPVYEEDEFGATAFYAVGGVKNGLYQTWYPNGQRKERAIYVNGREEGLVQQWFPSGQPYIIYTAKAGLKEGVAFRFYSNGAVAAQEFYVGDKEDGLATYYYESGAKQLEVLFEGGRTLSVQHYEADADAA
jgi:antitoxin component YwqK of YwqJK toxin-antitoxin module